jgi:hypothetical protein
MDPERNSEQNPERDPVQNPERPVSASSERMPFGRRHPVLKWTAVCLLVFFAGFVAAVAVLAHRAEPMLRARIVAELQEHFHARVELDSFHVSLLGGLRAEGRGLRIWPPAEVHGISIPASGDKPLISLENFRFRAPLHYAPGRPIRISVVQMRGLTVDMPPKSRFSHATGSAASGAEGSGPAGSSPPGSPVDSKVKQALIHFVVNSLDCTDVHLILEPGKPDKQPLEFAIASLKLTNIESGGRMNFTADLTNARPVGVIRTSGTFGPWTVDDPGASAITGEYTFDRANLGDFKGIAGMLNSTGKYQGEMRNLTIDGVTDTPDFRLTMFGTPMNLQTQFHALVDATNGDTWLEPVKATLGDSDFTVQGEIVGLPAGFLPVSSSPGESAPSPGGHEISLMVDIPHGHMEDFLRLTSKNGVPLMTGQLTLKSSVEIPPGKAPAHERIRLKGRFSLDDAQFTNQKIQERMADLSFRGQGDPKAAKESAAAAQVRASMQSDFTMEHGVITLPDLKYSMPGADIAMAGAYGVQGGQLDFTGTAKMQATVSKMIGGWKGLLAKPVDRFFKKDGAGTEVPIQIDGTREDPHFSVDFNRLKTTSPESPGQSQ